MNSRIPIKRAEEIAKNHNNQVVIIIGLDDSGEKIQLTTYGKDRNRCAWAKEVGDILVNGIINGEIKLPDFENIKIKYKGKDVPIELERLYDLVEEAHAKMDRDAARSEENQPTVYDCGKRQG